MKRVSRTTLSKLAAPVLLPEVDLVQVAGGAPLESRWCISPPRDPDDIFRLDDH
jgi:hypothetical protein